jgi:hypothetical protein
MKNSTLSNEKNLTKENQSLLILILQGAKKNSFLYLKCYNLVIYVVSFFEKNSTHYFNSPRQDPMVGSQEK